MKGERNILFLALGLIVVSVLFSGTFTGNVSHGRGQYTCSDTDGGNERTRPGTVVENNGGRETWYADRCVNSRYNRNGEEVSRIVEYYCADGERRFKEDWCPAGTRCITGRDAGGSSYGSTAYCS